MKKIWNAFLIAFSMYSRIPVPRADWSEDNLRYAFCFFPLVGCVIGGLVYGFFRLAVWLGFQTFFLAAVITAIPVLVTGGIHVDGFLDTSDALASHQPKERKLEILKDSHTGAFAIIACCVWFLLYAAGIGELNRTAISILCIGFPLSRALSAAAILHFRPAKPTGLAATFRSHAGKTGGTIVLSIWIAAAAAGMLLLSPIFAAIALAAALSVFLVYRILSYRQFGGVTGDLAGWFLQMCELTICLALAVTTVVVNFLA